MKKGILRFVPALLAAAALASAPAFAADDLRHEAIKLLKSRFSANGIRSNIMKSDRWSQIQGDGCGAHYRKVEAGESPFLDRTLKMCSDMAPHSPGVLVRTATGFAPLVDGHLCVHEGPFPKDAQCPDEFPLFVGIADVWYGCLSPDASAQADKSQIRCSDGFHPKYSFSSSFYCVDDQDEDGDLVDSPENVCGTPSAEIAFAGIAENPNMMVHCCGLRAFPSPEDGPHARREASISEALSRW